MGRVDWIGYESMTEYLSFKFICCLHKYAFFICAFKDAYFISAFIKMLFQFAPVYSCSKSFRWEGLIGLNKSMTEYLSLKFIFAFIIKDAFFIGAFIKMHILSAPLKMPSLSAPLQRCSFSLRLFIVALNDLDGKG